MCENNGYNWERLVNMAQGIFSSGFFNCGFTCCEAVKFGVGGDVHIFDMLLLETKKFS